MPQFAHLIKPAIEYLQMPYNILPVLPQQQGHKFEHTIKIKGHPSLIILTNLVDLESPILYTKIQLQSFLSTGDTDSYLIPSFKCFYHIWPRQPSCSVVQNHLKNCQHPFDKRPHVKSGENWSSGFREEDVLKIS